MENDDIKEAFKIETMDEHPSIIFKRKKYYAIKFIDFNELFPTTIKPIISADLKEIADLLRKFNYRLVASSCKELKLYLEKLYNDREFTKKIGENCRKTLEKYFDYELLDRVLYQKLVSYSVYLY